MSGDRGGALVPHLLGAEETAVRAPEARVAQLARLVPEGDWCPGPSDLLLRPFSQFRVRDVFEHPVQVDTFVLLEMLPRDLTAPVNCSPSPSPQPTAGVTDRRMDTLDARFCGRQKPASRTKPKTSGKRCPVSKMAQQPLDASRGSRLVK